MLNSKWEAHVTLLQPKARVSSKRGLERIVRERDDDNVEGNVLWAQVTQCKERYTDLVLVGNDG